MEKICQRGEGTSKEPNERLRLVFFAPLLSTSENESNFNLFVSKIATRLSGTGSSS